MSETKIRFDRAQAQFIESVTPGEKKTWEVPSRDWRFPSLASSDWSKVGRVLEIYKNTLPRLAAVKVSTPAIKALSPAQCLVLAMNDALSRLSNSNSQDMVKMIHFGTYGLENSAAWVRQSWTNEERRMLETWSAASKLKIASGALERLAPSHIPHHWVCVLPMASDGRFEYHEGLQHYVLEALYPDPKPPLVATTVTPLLILCREDDVVVTTLAKLRHTGRVSIAINREWNHNSVRFRLDPDEQVSTAIGKTIQYASRSFVTSLLQEFVQMEEATECTSLEHLKQQMGI